MQGIGIHLSCDQFSPKEQFGYLHAAFQKGSDIVSRNAVVSIFNMVLDSIPEAMTNDRG
jgi:hypothetical protein